MHPRELTGKATSTCACYHAGQGTEFHVVNTSCRARYRHLQGVADALFPVDRGCYHSCFWHRLEGASPTPKHLNSPILHTGRPKTSGCLERGARKHSFRLWGRDHQTCAYSFVEPAFFRIRENNAWLSAVWRQTCTYRKHSETSHDRI
jgi:hypothetical protein